MQQYGPPEPFSILLVVVVALVVYVFFPLLSLFFHQSRSPLRLLLGPPAPSLFIGNLVAFADQENTDIITTWSTAYGPTFTYRGFIGGRRLLTTDPAALAWILGRAYEFPKPEFVRDSLATMVGGHDGLLCVEGEVHRRQRKVLNQAFTTSHIKSLLPIFWSKASQLRNIFISIATDPSSPSSVTTSIPTNPPTSATSPTVDSFAILRSLDPVRPSKPLSPVADAPTEGKAGNLRKRKRKVENPMDAEARRTVQTEAPHERRNGDAQPVHSEVYAKHELACVDVLSWLGRATLDVIGEAGFGYQFNALSSQDNELANAFGVIFSTARKFRVFSVLQIWFPFLRRFRPNNAIMRNARATMHRIGMQLIHQKRSAVESEYAKTGYSSGPSPFSSSKPPLEPEIEGDKSTLGRDILSVLIRANMSSEPKQQLDLTEVLSTISTFLAAGHETTASALTWTLYALARSPSEQRKLRHTLRSLCPFDHPDNDASNGDSEPSAELMAAIEKHEPLDRVVKEALRLHAPIGSTMRTYMGEEEEVVVPLSRGVRVKTRTRNPGWAKSIGKLCKKLWNRVSGSLAEEDLGPDDFTVERGVRMRRGDIVTIPIQAVNRDKEIWGEDAREFKPDRWLNLPPTVNSISGLYSNTLTFLNGSPVVGNRACIGYRFALAEIKIFLYVLLRDIEFTLDENIVIEKRVNVVTRPFVKSAPDLGNQMPLRIRRLSPLEDEDPEQ